jgi:hypothetical protein
VIPPIPFDTFTPKGAPWRLVYGSRVVGDPGDPSAERALDRDADVVGVQALEPDRAVERRLVEELVTAAPLDARRRGELMSEGASEHTRLRWRHLAAWRPKLGWLVKLGAFLVLLDVISGICVLLGGALYALYLLVFAGG